MRTVLMVTTALVLVGCRPPAAGTPDSPQQDLAELALRVERLETRDAEQVEALGRLEERTSSLEGLSKQVAGVEAKLQEVEESSVELYDDAIDQIVTIRDSLTTQISKLRQDLAERQMRELAGRDLGELRRMLAEGGVELDEERGVVRVSGSFCQTRGIVEFLAVSEGGRDHESLLYLDCVPSLLNAALLSLGLEGGEPFHIEERKPGAPPGGLDYGTEEEPLLYYPPEGPRVHVYVQWKEGDREVRKRAEELLFDTRSEQPMKSGGWVFLGSRFAVDERTGEEVYVADITRNIISIWHSFRGNTILDNPHAGGMYDDTYVPRTDVLPEGGTPVEVVFATKPQE